MHQCRRPHVPEDLEQPLDPIPLRRAAALQRHVDKHQTKMFCGVAAKGVGAIAAPAAQVDQRLQTIAPRERDEPRRRRMIAPIQPPRRDRRKVAPDQAEHRVVDQQRIDPGKRASTGGADIASENAVHRS